MIHKQRVLPKKQYNSMYHKQAMWGRLFILPWAIGVITFFLIPLFQTVIYTFNKISISSSGFVLNYVGFENYNYLFNRDPDFKIKFTSTLGNMFPQVIFIVLFSMFIAILLKDKFHGRTLARAIYFLPVIISTGVVITVLQENVSYSGGNTSLSAVATYIFQAPSFSDLLNKINVPDKLITGLANYVINPLFNLVLKSGVQILLMLAAVVSIPQSYYEVCSIEGATEWEKFWKITFPLVTPTLLVTVIYTIIDTFTDYGNQVMRMVSSWFSKQQYEYSTTIAFIYFLCIFVIIGLIYLIFAKRVVYISE